MKSYLKPGMILATVAMGVIPFAAQADNYDKKTVITIDEPIQVENAYLEPGTYVFKLINSESDRHIVEIYNKNESHLIDMIIAVPNYRLRPTSSAHTQFTFWETPPGTAKAVRAWFYPGENYGHEFKYPKNLKQVSAVSSVTQTTATTAAAAAPAPAQAQTQAAVSEKTDRDDAQVTAPAPAPAPEPVREAQAEQPAPQQLAQNTPAPAPQVQQAPAPQAASDETPAASTTDNNELPKTASPYPMIGLAGLVSLGLFSMLRMKRLS